MLVNFNIHLTAFRNKGFITFTDKLSYLIMAFIGKISTEGSMIVGCHWTSSKRSTVGGSYQKGVKRSPGSVVSSESI